MPATHFFNTLMYISLKFIKIYEFYSLHKQSYIYQIFYLNIIEIKWYFQISN